MTITYKIINYNFLFFCVTKRVFNFVSIYFLCLFVFACSWFTRLSDWWTLFRLSEGLRNGLWLKSSKVTSAPFLTSPGPQFVDTSHWFSHLCYIIPRQLSFSHCFSFSSQSTSMELTSILGTFCQPRLSLGALHASWVQRLLKDRTSSELQSVLGWVGKRYSL